MVPVRSGHVVALRLRPKSEFQERHRVCQEPYLLRFPGTRSCDCLRDKHLDVCRCRNRSADEHTARRQNEGNHRKQSSPEDISSTGSSSAKPDRCTYQGAGPLLRCFLHKLHRSSHARSCATHPSGHGNSDHRSGHWATNVPGGVPGNSKDIPIQYLFCGKSHCERSISDHNDTGGKWRSR